MFLGRGAMSDDPYLAMQHTFLESGYAVNDAATCFWDCARCQMIHITVRLWEMCVWCVCGGVQRISDDWSHAIILDFGTRLVLADHGFGGTSPLFCLLQLWFHDVGFLFWTSCIIPFTLYQLFVLLWLPRLLFFSWLGTFFWTGHCYT